ncbi:polysaccharide export protein [Algicella marina]|uniref:Polysaccharide export protein n=2 Tax=Algicella marina TaxID=2683284 RepID=A0A6P1T7I4_9RHOB|nr:polysaccharide export protein [Algicella marina]
MAVVSACIVALSGCALPRSGPKDDEILAGSKAEGGPVNVVLVDNRVAVASYLDDNLSFPSSFTGAGLASTDTINPGDVISVTVWENVDPALLVGPGQKQAFIQEIQVDQAGNIFMPYAGVLKAAGNTPEQLRRLITRKLDPQTPDPQVEVRRVAGDGSSISVIGGVGAQGVYPLVPSTTRLSAMLATAGGVTIDPDVAQVAVRRGGTTGRIFLQDLYDDPRLDVALRANDKIIVEEDRRTFTALGATSTQARVPFPQGRMSVVEAVAEVGGLNGNTSDPTGIFVFRREVQSIANKVTGRNDLGENEPFVYVIDLTRPDGVFLAKEFQVRDKDTIYITEAPFVAWTKILTATSQTLSFTADVVRVGDLLTDN